MRYWAFLICGLLSATSVFSANRVICVTQNSAKIKNEIPAGARVVSTLQKGIDLAGRYKQRGDSVILLIAGGTYTLDKTLEMTSLQLGDGNSRLVVRPLMVKRLYFTAVKRFQPNILRQRLCQRSEFSQDYMIKLSKLTCVKQALHR